MSKSTGYPGLEKVLKQSLKLLTTCFLDTWIYYIFAIQNSSDAKKYLQPFSWKVACFFFIFSLKVWNVNRFYLQLFCWLWFQISFHTNRWLTKNETTKRVSTGHWLFKAEEHFCCEMREPLLQPISCLDVTSAADNTWCFRNFWGWSWWHFAGLPYLHLRVFWEVLFQER